MTPDETWEIRIQALRDYVRKHGNAQVPVKYVTWINGIGDVHLGTWVSYLRTQYRLGKLLPEQIKVLESFQGWEWRLKPGPTRDGDRLREMVELREAGLSFAAIGKQFQISRQRVHQLLQDA